MPKLGTDAVELQERYRSRRFLGMGERAGSVQTLKLEKTPHCNEVRGGQGPCLNSFKNKQPHIKFT